MKAGIHIDRCTCFDRTFADLKHAIGGERVLLEDVTKRFGCGGDCGLCRPYLERMLETGETVFHQVLLARPPKSRE